MHSPGVHVGALNCGKLLSEMARQLRLPGFFVGSRAIHRIALFFARLASFAQGANGTMRHSLLPAVCAGIALCFAEVAAASPRDDVLKALENCATISDDKARLACYDALVRPAQTALSRPPEPQEATAPPTKEEQQSWFGFDISGLFGASPSQQTTPQQFGSENLPATKEKVEKAEKEIDSITAGVTEYAYTPFGKFIVFLDNNQVWRQLQGDADHVIFRKVPKDNKVTISRGFIGSYNMKINDSDKIFKVERIK